MVKSVGKEVGDIIFLDLNFEDCSMVMGGDLIDVAFFERKIDDPLWNPYSEFSKDEKEVIIGPHFAASMEGENHLIKAMLGFMEIDFCIKDTILGYQKEDNFVRTTLETIGTDFSFRWEALNFPNEDFLGKVSL